MDDEQRRAAAARVGWLRMASQRARKLAMTANISIADLQRLLTLAQTSDVYADELEAELDALPPV